MERIITITSTTDGGGAVAVPIEDVEGVLTAWYSGDYYDDPYIKMCVDDISSWAKAGAQMDEYNGAGIYLGIELSVGLTANVPVHELNYRHVLSP